MAKASSTRRPALAALAISASERAQVSAVQATADADLMVSRPKNRKSTSCSFLSLPRSALTWLSPTAQMLHKTPPLSRPLSTLVTSFHRRLIRPSKPLLLPIPVRLVLFAPAVLSISLICP